jgi:DNA primase
MSNQHCDLIGRYCKKIVLMLDGDEAGIDAIKSSIERARSKNLFVNVVKLKDSIDPDQLTQDQLSFICNKTKTNDEELLIKI